MLTLLASAHTRRAYWVALGTCVLTVGLNQQILSAQAASGTNGPSVDTVFRNIRVLKGLPAELLNPTMVFFEAALGVGCEHCHTADPDRRDLDVKPQKMMARRMIEMVTALNKSTFGGTNKVTCFTCHMGRAIPMRVPIVTGAELPPALGSDYVANQPPPPAVPAIDPREVLDRFFAASGGGAGVQKSPSLVAAGTVTQRRPGRQVPAQQVEISSKAPGMELIATRVGPATNVVAYGADHAWAKAGEMAPRDLRKAEGDATKLEDAFNIPAQLKQMLVDPKMERPEVIDGREVYVVGGRTQYLPQVMAYFTKENGMLRRLVYYIDTPFGQYPTQIEYSAFQDVGGRTVPYSWVISQTRNREYTWAMQSVRAVAVEDSKFTRPLK